MEARRFLFGEGYLGVTSVMAEEAAETGKHLQQETTVVNSQTLSPTKPSSNQEPEVMVSNLLTCATTADDPMLGFLTLLAKVERPSCANCESKDLSPMFFCNTCGKFYKKSTVQTLN